MIPTSRSPRPHRVHPIAAPLRKQVIEELRDAIIAFEYEPGQRLVERDLCERFEASRTVIREALRQLEAEGLVDLVPNRGPIVSSPTRDQAEALYEVREVLEALAVRCFTMRATAAQKRQLVRALARMESTYGRGDLREQLAAKDQFYTILCDGTGNPVITSLLRTVQARVQLARSLSLRAPGRPQESLQELMGVMAAIERGDVEGGGELAAQHVRNAGATAFRVLSEMEATTQAFAVPGRRHTSSAAPNNA